MSPPELSHGEPVLRYIVHVHVHVVTFTSHSQYLGTVCTGIILL